jgi:GntR family transcriptional regulator
MEGAGETQHRGLEAQPLYRQVVEVIRAGITNGRYRPGEALPSEFKLADELKVSQGTVRKALDELAQRNILVRAQGRGTFVATHTAERSLFHFLHVVDRRDNRQLPESRILECGSTAASEVEADRLGIAVDAAVLRIVRVRTLQGKPVIFDRIAVPIALFPDLGSEHGPALPNTLYDLYQRRYGITIARAVERLRAVAAGPDEACQLDVPPGSPLLEIDRVAVSLDGRAAEWRLSRVSTEHHHYLCEVE